MGGRALLSIESSGECLAEGSIALTRERFWQQRKRRGGWLHGRVEGSLKIAVGCRTGVLALGLPGALGIVVTDASEHPAAVTLTLELEGLERVPAAPSMQLETDAQGQATLTVVPRDLSAAIGITVGSGSADTNGAPLARYFSSIPIEPSTLNAEWQRGKLIAKSEIPLQKAYFSLVDAQGRWAAGSVRLYCDNQGHCQGETPIEAQPPSPSWLMLGTEPALDGPTVVGWPVAATATPLVAESVVACDQLLLDGRNAVMAEAARRNATRYWRVVVGIGVTAALLLLAMVAPLMRSRRERQALAAEWPEGESSEHAASRPAAFVGLLLLVLVALVALILWAKSRIIGG